MGQLVGCNEVIQAKNPEPAGQSRHRKLEVRESGIHAGGICLLWEHITGIVLDEGRCRLVTTSKLGGVARIGVCLVKMLSDGPSYV